ncbi:MAG: hypothetical protein ACI8S6_003693 [Myxococcota bacterium]|jgi:hypothetical protein
MQSGESTDRSPMLAVTASIRGGLEPGQVGVVLAQPGVGKSAFLVHAGLQSLIHGVNVLHISLTDTKSHVRSYYTELFSQITRSDPSVTDQVSARVAMERHRVIHSCLGRPFGPPDLRKIAAMLAEVMDFQPQLVVIDGLTPATLGEVGAWQAAAQAHAMRLWVSLRIETEHDTAALVEPFSAAVSLTQGAEDVLMTVLRTRSAPAAGRTVRLDPLTMLVRPEDAQDPTTAPPSPPASQCTLYSGGAMGSEAFFGQAAEKWGVGEVNFTFVGHNQKRTVGRRELSPQELDAGTVSLTYVSHRLHRHWEKTPLLRKVLQTLWHVVSHADQVFVIGEIKENGTVHGGTGWSVELARRWHKPTWVFDQAQEAWFLWDGQGWREGVPVIESVRFAGSGTRFLSPSGEAAIEELFARSFSPVD